MSAEMADYIQIFLLGMILCFFVLRSIDDDIRTSDSIGRGPDNYLLSAVMGLIFYMIFLALATAFVFGLVYGGWWLVTQVDWG